VTRRTTTWWQGVDDAADAPEPWADQPLVAPALTADQRAVLAGLADQPAPPRLDGWDGDDPADQPAIPRWRPGNGTGNAPGDTDPARSYRARRWTETEQDS
jgi:hypothetical protein